MTARGRGDGRRPGCRALAAVVLAGCALALCSCTAETGSASPSRSGVSGGVGAQSSASPEPGGTDSAAVPGEETPAEPSAEDAPAPDTGPATIDISGSVEAALRALAEEQESVTREQVRSAIERGFTDADAVPEVLEVSIDRTPTGLDVESIQGSGLIAGECVVGEIREGAVSVTVLPVLATGLCFVGDQR